MNKYSDNYMTDEKGQRWVKKEYVQTYFDRLQKAEKEIATLKRALDMSILKNL